MRKQQIVVIGLGVVWEVVACVDRRVDRNAVP